MKLAWTLFITTFAIFATVMPLVSLYLLPGVYTAVAAVLSIVLVVINVWPWRKS